MAWGYNSDGQCEVPDPNADFVLLAPSFYHTACVKADGTIVAWGKNDDGRCDVPSPNEGFVAIATGSAHTLAIRTAPIGACCRLDGTCIIRTQSGCEPGGIYQGDGTTCVPNPCPPGGACCVADGTCSLTSQDDCQGDAVWQGVGTNCDPNPCLSGGCCLNAYCLRTSEDECLSYGGTFEGNGTLCEPNPCPTSDVGDEANESASRQRGAAPNPFVESTWIRYEQKQTGWVAVSIYDAGGREVRQLVSGVQAAGDHSAAWDGRDNAGRRLPAGVYLAKVWSTRPQATWRLVLSK